MKIGYIPTHLKYYCKPEQPVGFDWDDVGIQDSEIKSIQASSVFVTDRDNPKTQATAQRWADVNEWEMDPTTKKRVKSNKNATVIDVPNDPITNVRIVDLHVRGNGGRAYRALINDKYLVDMREDVMLDAMINCGMDKNAILRGEYVFALVCSEMKLVRIGSLLHSKMIESTAFSKKSTIDKLEIGHIYRSKTKTCLYLGQVYRRCIIRESCEKGNSFYSRSYLNAKYILDKPILRHMVIELPDGADYSNVSNFNDILKIQKGLLCSYGGSYYGFSEKPSKSYRECVGKIDIPDVEAILEKLRNIDELLQLPKSQSKHFDMPYYSERMNISTIEGFVHPIVEEFLKSQ